MAIAPHSRILAVNCGSATLKAGLYECDVANDPRLILSVKTASEDSRTRVQITGANSSSLFDGDTSSANDEVAFVLDWLARNNQLHDLAAVGHRVVHGGAQFTQPQCITAEVLAALDKLIPLDPDHLPAAISGIRQFQERFPRTPQIACFDTAFHASLPQVASLYAIPRRFYESGIRRYGFHGLSCEFILRKIQSLERDSASTSNRIIVAHLGAGASVTAILNGKSIDTSMGFTPLEGLVMATRSGDVDPGVLIYLLDNGASLVEQTGGPSTPSAPAKILPGDLSKLLNKDSGLLGVSETSEDMRELLAKSASDPRAAEAVDLFCYRVKKYIGAYAAALGGLDLLVFTAGIGERAAGVRERICGGLEFLGVTLDPQRNHTNDSIISTSESRVKIRVIPTNEELTIVRHVLALLDARGARV